VAAVLRRRKNDSFVTLLHSRTGGMIRPWAINSTRSPPWVKVRRTRPEQNQSASTHEADLNETVRHFADGPQAGMPNEQLKPRRTRTGAVQSPQEIERQRSWLIRSSNSSWYFWAFRIASRRSWRSRIEVSIARCARSKSSSVSLTEGLGHDDRSRLGGSANHLSGTDAYGQAFGRR
jgi:hypothetical protein